MKGPDLARGQFNLPLCAAARKGATVHDHDNAVGILFVALGATGHVRIAAGSDAINGIRIGDIAMSMNAFGDRGLRRVLALALVSALGSLGLPQGARADPPYVGEVICGGWNFCPAGWAECNGAVLPISGNDTLFTLIGTTYGGDGQSTFALPNIAGRTMVHTGQGPGLSNWVLGQSGGVETVTLSSAQMPSHNHQVQVHTGLDQSASPTNRIVGPTTASTYSSAAANSILGSAAVGSAGGSQPHNNLQPYLAAKCCISLFGIFPSQ